MKTTSVATAPMSKTPKANSMSAGQLNTYMSKVYLWMIIGLGISGFVAYYMAGAPYLEGAIVDSSWCFWVIFGLQMLFCFFFRRIVYRLGVTASTLLYMLYSATTGIVLSVLTLSYTAVSIDFVFFGTALGFFCLSAFGLLTRRNLNGVGSFCITGLFGILGVCAASIFLPSLRSNMMQLALSALGVLVFSGLTAYDSYKIKRMAQLGILSGRAGVLNGAFMLYLDFINLFFDLLSLFGRRR